MARYGVRAPDYLFATGICAGGGARVTPQLIRLDLKLQKVYGFQVLREIRADQRTRRLQVVSFTSSSEEEDLINSYNLGS